MQGLKRIGYHLLGWTLYLMYEWFGKANVLAYPKYMEMEFLASLTRVTVIAATTYFVLYILIERLHSKFNRPTYIVAIILSMIIGSLLARGLTYALVYCHYNPYISFEYAYKDISKVIVSVVSATLVICAVLMLHFNTKWQHQAIVNRKLEAASKEAQLLLLKSQLQPHFIFNTLNNIYTLSQQSSPKTSDMIYRLSALLDYMLYDSTSKLIAVDKEWNYILNYIELEKIRYGNVPDIRLNITPEAKNFWLPPLLLLPFVENAFKHGLSLDTSQAWLIVNVFMELDWFVFSVENSKPKGIFTKVKGGLGINNIKQHLQLLYPTSHELKIINNDDSFLIVLKLKTINHD